MNDKRGNRPASSPRLSADQRHRVERAREAAAKSIRDIAPGENDPATAAGYAFGVMQTHVGRLLEVIGELTGGES